MRKRVGVNNAANIFDVHWISQEQEYLNSCLAQIAQYTPPTPTTQLSSRVASAEWTHPSTVVTQFTIFCAVCCWAITVGDKWRHNDVIVEKKLSVKIHVVKQ